MKKLIIPLMFCVMLSQAQEKSWLEKKGYMLGGVVVFSAFDYIGYNLTKNDHGVAPIGYRIAQLLVQAGITKFLIDEVGLPEAIGFNVIWWTWGADLMYYQWGRILPPHDMLTANKQVTWASWTPVGLIRGGKKPIAHNTLFAQATIGLSISLAL
jgi:hypothetical protein